MRPLSVICLALGSIIALSVQGLAGAGAPASRSESLALERFINHIDRPPVSYQAHRRLEASSSKLNESAWLEAVTEYVPGTGFRYRITSQGGSNRIRNRVLKPALEAERESSAKGEWRKGALTQDNYDFDVNGLTADGMVEVELNPRRKDSRLVDGAAWLSAQSGALMRLEGRLSKSPSFWVKWVDVSRNYGQIRGAMMPVAMESTADVRIAGLSTFSMRYEYTAVDGHTIALPQILASR